MLVKEFIYETVPVRTKTDDDEQTWFAAVDICDILDYSNPTQTIEKLEEDERMLDYTRDSSGQKRKTWMINECGLYSLILSSSKSEARPFKRWVTHDVLPTIRKAGRYTTEEMKMHEKQLKEIADKIKTLKDDKDTHQRKVNDLKKDIEKFTSEMIRLVNIDPRQKRIEWID